MDQEPQSGGWSNLSRGAQIGIIIAAVAAIVLLLWLLSRAFGGGSAPDPTPTATTEAAEVPELSTPIGGTTPGTGDGTDGGIIIIIPTPLPGLPSVTAIDPTNIRSGPSTEYPVVGLLNAGESAEAIGVSQDGAWYAIRIPQSPQGSGWILGTLVSGAGVDGLPIIVAPPLPTPTASPPVAITEWKGEYFDNPNLSGAPVLVRNDVAIDFNWGTGSPAPEVPADNFSARWTINRNVPAGLYTFDVWVDDGVRVWVDRNLIINGWNSGPARRYTASAEVTQGAHEVIVEYFEATGTALISFNTGYQDPAQQQPPSSRINGPNEGLVGEEMVYDGTASVAQDGARIVEYRWNFGDGKSATGDLVSYRWAEPNVYNLTLTVVDDQRSRVQLNHAGAHPAGCGSAAGTDGNCRA